jgi:hypothetical protein
MKLKHATYLNNPGQYLHLLPVDDQEMMALYCAAALPSTQAVCEISANTLEKALREADTAAKQKSNDWIRRAVTSKTTALDAKDIIDKFVSFLSAGVGFIHNYLQIHVALFSAIFYRISLLCK